MHFSSFLATATIALSAICGVSGTCFHSGQNWGDHGVAKGELAEACKKLQGTYNVGQVRNVCRNSGPISYRFEIKNGGGGDVRISQADCNRYIGEQIDHCGHGGQITRSGTRFRYVSSLVTTVIIQL